MKKAAIELNMRTIVLFILFLVIVVVLIGIAFIMNGYAGQGIENVTAIADKFNPVV